MDAARWDRVRSLLERALDVEPSARAAWIAQECGADQELRADIETLLARDSHTSTLEPPDAAGLARILADCGAGQRVGPYELVRRLGEGGMGSVFLGRRIDADFEQEVAVKLIKRGMDTDDVLRQFQRERALLSSLEHPCIARLLDGGATSDGRPWFAMERIEGEPIDVWCAARALSIRARIALFLQVCSAVQHAHQRLIVHRDLKPSNVLVTADGTPKLLDFGIAKLLVADDGRPRTVAVERRLTPDYASPEQLRGEPVSTATDVYSLGILLYELLAGVQPFRDAADPLAARETPSRPSKQARRLEPAGPSERRIGSRLHRDLDTIALTALEPRVDRRYASVDALAADLRRHLEHLPIQARPATTAYRLSKFVARNRVAVATGSIVITALAAGLIAARAGYLEALEQGERARLRELDAKREALRANSVLELTRRMLSAASPHDVRDKDYTLRRLLDDFDSEAGDWRGEPDVEASVRQTMGVAYLSLGLLEPATRQLSRVLELLPQDSGDVALEAQLAWCDLLHSRADYTGGVERLDSIVARDPAPALLAAALCARGDALRHLGRYDESERDLDRALGLARGLQLPGARMVCNILNELGMTLIELDRRTDGETRMRECIELARSTFGPRSELVATALNNLGLSMQARGELADAAQTLGEAAEIERELHGADHAGLGQILNNLGLVRIRSGDYAAARPLLEEALRIARSNLGPEHPNVATDLSTLATAHERLGDFAQAEEAFRECLAIRSKALGEEHADTLRALNNLGNLLGRRAKYDEAAELLQRCIEVRRRVLGPDDLALAASLSNLSGVLLNRDQMAEAESAAREAVSIYRARLGPAHVDLAAGLSNLSSVLLRKGDAPGAIAMLRETLEMREKLLDASHPDVSRDMTNLGQTLVEHGELDEGQALLAESLRLHRERGNAPKPTLARTLHWHAVAEERREHAETAEVEYREALELWRGMLGVAHANTRRTAIALVGLLERRGDAQNAQALRTEFQLPPTAKE